MPCHYGIIFYICNLKVSNSNERNKRIMANKRDLKRTINVICADLFAECVAASLYNGKPDKDNVNALLSSILSINNDFVSRISHPEPGMPQKQFYQTIIDDFNKQVGEIIDQIGNLQ